MKGIVFLYLNSVDKDFQQEQAIYVGIGVLRCGCAVQPEALAAEGVQRSITYIGGAPFAQQTYFWRASCNRSET